jgi:hypothetical protein
MCLTYGVFETPQQLKHGTHKVTARRGEPSVGFADAGHSGNSGTARPTAVTAFSSSSSALQRDEGGPPALVRQESDGGGGLRLSLSMGTLARSKSGAEGEAGSVVGSPVGVPRPVATKQPAAEKRPTFKFVI